MSKEILIQAFTNMRGSDSWSLQLLKVNGEGESVSYCARQIELIPDGKIKSFAEVLVKKYLSADGIPAFSSVDNYTGDVVGKVIYKLDCGDELIASAYNMLVKQLGSPDTEGNIEAGTYQAYVLQTTIGKDENKVPVRLVSMQSPVSLLSNRFILRIQRRSFKEITEPVLTLRRTIDVVIVGQTVYMLTLAGENLFAMERAYKAVCKEKVSDVIGCGFITNPERFKEVATFGQNPRRFVSYNQKRLDALRNINERKRLATKFGLALSGNSIDTNDEKTPERLVKFLCDKAMLDPLDDSPVEVSAAKSWK